MRAILTVLPYAGFVLSAVSTIWGLTHELYTKDDQNKRHLTREGRYSVALTLLGLVISFNSGILKTIVDNQDKADAKDEQGRKDQAATLKELARQQQEEAREREARDAARTTQEKIDREAQERRDNELAQQQRDLALAQQQVQGFAKAESLARWRTLAELQRSNRILWDVRRTQFPLTKDIQITFTIRVSNNHPELRAYSGQIEDEARRLVEYQKQNAATPFPWFKRSPDGHTLIQIFQDHYLFNDPRGIPPILSDPNLGVSIVRQGSNIDPALAPSDISFIYTANVFGERIGNITSQGSIDYIVEDHSYLITAPTMPPKGFTFYSSGRISSLLDLPGATIRLTCVQSTYCDSITMEALRLELLPGLEIEIKGNLFKRERLNGHAILIHTFDPDPEHFFEKYRPE